MSSKFSIYNTYKGELEVFTPLEPPFVGIYLCGPTVYGDPHLGHARGPVVIDILVRYLKHLGYRVRYVRNITDVGHILDSGDDRIERKAKLDNVEPMEVVQTYTLAYHKAIYKLNLIPPNIEPSATGHIQEQIHMVKSIIENGYAYEVNGSVYFDVIKYADEQDYGRLSGRKIEDLIAGAGEARRALDGQEEKKNLNDFALWKNASPEHIMKWESPWGVGFPGWHIECSAMSARYLGKKFDIHAGGMDLLFPHHESEIAQSTACFGESSVRYWMHNNMITINGQKMAKSLDNGILLEELFTGEHHLLDKAYSPMTMKLFLLMAHYRSTVDFSNEALLAAEKGYERLTESLQRLDEIQASTVGEVDVEDWKNNLYNVMNDDLNTPKAVALMFDAVRWINAASSSKLKISVADLELLKATFKTFYFDILGLEKQESSYDSKEQDLVKLLLSLRNSAKEKKDYETADRIRNELNELGIEIMDSKEGTNFKLKR